MRTGFLDVVFCSLMARTKQTTKVVEEANIADSGSDTGLSFEFGLSRITSGDLDSFARAGWFARDVARPSGGETIPKPQDDEVVGFKEFFLRWAKVSTTSTCYWGFEEV